MKELQKTQRLWWWWGYKQWPQSFQQNPQSEHFHTSKGSTSHFYKLNKKRERLWWVIKWCRTKIVFSSLTLGYLTQKALSGHIAGDGSEVGATIGSDCCPVPHRSLKCCLMNLCALFGQTEMGANPLRWLAHGSHRREACLILPFVFLECCILWKLKCFVSPTLLISQVRC